MTKPKTRKSTRKPYADKVGSGSITREGSPDTIVIKRTDKVQRREAWVAWTQVVANVVVPLTLFVAVYSLYQQGLIQKDQFKQAQLNASDRQVEMFYSEGLSQAQSTLFNLWSDEDLSILREPRPRAFIDAFVERTIISSEIPKDRINAAIVGITSYFDRVQSCVVATRCDETQIHGQVGQYGRDFYCLYQGQIQTIAAKNHAEKVFGAGAKAFAQKLGGCT